MPLWKKKKEEIPEKYREMTDEQLLAALSKADEDSTKRTEAETALAAEQTEHGKAKAALQALEANLGRKPQQQQQQQSQQQQQQQQNANPDEVPSFFDDEEAAFNHRAKPLAAATIQAGTMAAKSEAIRTAQGNGDFRVWQKYENEVNAIMEQELPMRRIYPQTWLNALTFVKGLHMKDIMSAKGTENDLFAEARVDTGKPAGSETTQQEDKLSPEELKICTKMRIKPEDYLKRKKAIQVAQV